MPLCQVSSTLNWARKTILLSGNNDSACALHDVTSGAFDDKPMRIPFLRNALICKSIVFARDSPGTQLNLSFMMISGNCMCCTRPPHVPVATIFEISRYMYIRNGLLIRLLKILRQSTTGFALLGAHQVGAIPEFPSTLCST
ncbi:hypothetical protein CSKR_107911 [Clonorchis sinensis]|uniref:Uncharacterized protein n=1 Tax=Clonorchis sinensis TaxID=79923 RepID=A0A3R7CAZ2_CLOSI|nr:hypothetical protein CSKR_107911 [Clonorchis sinensis]